MEGFSVLRRLLANRIRLGLKDRSRYGAYYVAVDGRAANVYSIAKRLKASYQAINCPLIMISQVERSGEPLMAQLFDGHPQLLAHPHELKFGYPHKRVWPSTNLANLDKQFRVLFEVDNVDFCENGYTKGSHNSDRKNFFLLPHVQKAVFNEALKEVSEATSRDVLNAYFTSYFNAWLNMRTRINQARSVTGSVPMMASVKGNMDEFWRTYPDGYLISIVRSPLSWHPSFAKLKGLKRPQFSDVEVTAARWNVSTQAMFRERERMKDRVIVLSFDDLVRKTEATMRLVCRRIGLDFHPSLVNPTFNWEPMASNSIFGATAPGIVTSAPARRGVAPRRDRTQVSRVSLRAALPKGTRRACGSTLGRTGARSAGELALSDGVISYTLAHFGVLFFAKNSQPCCTNCTANVAPREFAGYDFAFV